MTSPIEFCEGYIPAPMGKKPKWLAVAPRLNCANACEDKEGCTARYNTADAQVKQMVANTLALPEWSIEAFMQWRQATQDDSRVSEPVRPPQT